MTKTDYVLYEESFANLVLYSAAMPQYDDIDTAKPTTDEPNSPKGVTVTKEAGKTVYKASNFRGFFNALKGVTNQ